MKTKLLFFIITIILIMNCKALKSSEEVMILLNDKQSITLKVNEKASYNFSLHESVGFTAEYIIADKNILECIDTKIKYHHPERMKPGMTGGDSALGTFIFKALKKGGTELIIKHLYRGELEKEVKIKVIVI